ncbi:hypothetical protein B0J11DRAFT_180037 [Dendryphion nanum]|uniref:Uncharacterized protein n=1 Tax=Dendryphion nanum TaxID=256645 RepID=A0A9P9D4X7_9PLEO|nr:hypothetical protein B0J11DRAFT_180037 [Dendryphion nanum]
MYATRQNGNGRQPDPSTKPKRAVKSPSNPLSLIRPKVEELSRSQQELSADRADLVDEREAFTSQGKDIRHQRIRTVAAEVQLMDAFRRAFNDASFPMPQDVVAAFQHVQEERDKLGPMEQEYLEADENLGASEWSLLEKEDRLYQFDLRDLLQSTTVYSDVSDHDEPSPRPSREEITPSPAIQYQAAVAHLHQVVVRFEYLRQQTVELANQRRPPDTDILDVIQDVVTNSHESADPSGELLMEIAVAQVRVQQLRQDILRESGQLHLRTRRNSEPAFLTGQQFSIDTISRAQTEGSIPDVLDNPPADERVQEWLENVLESNWDTNKRKQYLTCVNKEMELQGLSESNLNPWDDRLPQVLSGEKSFALTPGNSESLGWPGSPSRIHSDCFSFVDASIWTDVEPLQPKEMDDNRTISNHSSKTISGAENPPRISIVDHLGTSSPEPQEQTPCVPVQYPTDQPFDLKLLFPRTKAMHSPVHLHVLLPHYRKTHCRKNYCRKTRKNRSSRI